MRHVLFDRPNQIREASKSAAPNALPCDLREPSLNQGQLRGAGRDEVAVVAGPRRKDQALDRRMGVRALAVENQMDVALLRRHAYPRNGTANTMAHAKKGDAPLLL